MIIVNSRDDKLVIEAILPRFTISMREIQNKEISLTTIFIVLLRIILITHIPIMGYCDGRITR